MTRLKFKYPPPACALQAESVVHRALVVTSLALSAPPGSDAGDAVGGPRACVASRGVPQAAGPAKHGTNQRAASGVQSSPNRHGALVTARGSVYWAMDPAGGAPLLGQGP